MGDKKRNSRHTDQDVIDLTDPLPLGQTNSRMEGARTLDEIVVSLKKEKSRLDKVSTPGNEYEVETTISLDSRQWCFISSAKHNGHEITDDSNLLKDELCRKRVTQANKTKALWNLFVKEAAEIHLEKCSEIQNRHEGPEKKAWGIKKQLISILGLIVFVSGSAGLYKFFYKPQPVKPIVLAPDQTDFPPPLTTISLTVDQLEPLAPLTSVEPAQQQTETPPPIASAEPSPEQPNAPPPVASTEMTLEKPQAPPPNTSTEPVMEQAEDPPPVVETQMTMEQTETSPPVAAAEPAQERTETPPEQPQGSPTLSPEEIRERVSSVLSSN